MTVILGSTCKAGDLVLTENLTFPGIKSLAAMLSLRLQGIAMDEHGLRPDAFEAACRTGAPRALYCVPTIQNPTTSVMPPQRRAEIAAIARQHGVTIIEDDIHAPLMTDPPQPIAALVPERSYYISSLSKCLAPGLRIAYVHVPDARAVESLAATILTTTGLASPLLAEIAGLWGEDGTARTLVQARRDEAAARHAIAREALDGLEMAAHPSGFHVWLHVPEPWRSDELVAHARQQGIALTPPSAFVVGRREAPHAVRVCLGAAPGRDRLRAGLRRLADLLRSAPTPIASMV
jgi:DNA-binding transcriptional MocR family regulator